MNTDFIKGVVVPIITVIDKEEKIEEEGMRRQVEFVISGGMHGILAFGSNGEFYQIEEDEMERGLKIMVDQAALGSERLTPASVCGWRRWRWRTEHPVYPFCSPCF